MRTLPKEIIGFTQARRLCSWSIGCFCALTVVSANAQTSVSNATELEAAIAAAASGDEILITGTISPTQQIVINKAVTIKSSVDGSYRTINGAGVSGEAVFKVTAAATLKYLSFSAANSGAVEASSGTIHHCKFLSNDSASGNGGAISIPSGTVKVDWCTFSSNTARDKGGGIYNKGNLTVNHSKFTGNSVTIYFGGAISNSGILNLYNSELNSANSAPGGGGIYSDGTMTVRNCDIKSNIATNGAVGGGGIYADSSYSLQNSIVRSNSPNQINGTVPTIATSNIQGDPTHDLGSSNVDAGTSSYWLNQVAYPLHGSNENLKRVQNGVVDIGAYESGNAQWSNFNLAWSVSPEGSATLGGTNHEDGSYAETTLITLSPVADTGKQFKQWTGSPFPAGKNPLTRILSFNIDQSYINLVAEFEDVTYSVNLNAPLTLAKIAGVWYDISSIQTGGAPLINVGLVDESNETTTGTYPDVAVITANPVSGFYLKDWWIQNDVGIDENASDPSSEFNATSPLTLTYEANWTVTPIFGEAVYSINLEGTPAEGSTSLFVIPPADGEFNVDENVTIEWEIADGYQLDTITFTNLTGQEVNASDLLGLSVYESGLDEEFGSFRFTLGGDIAVDLNVTVYFEPKSYSITFTEQHEGIQQGEVILQTPTIVPGSGELLPSGKYTEGTQLNLYARPLTGIDPNKIEVEWKYGNKEISTQNPHSLFMTEDLDVTVTYSVKQYKLTQKVIFLAGDENATTFQTYVELVSLHGWGEEVNSTVLYDAAGFDFNGSEYPDESSAPTSFTMTDDVTIHNFFVRKVHTVTAIAMQADNNNTLGGGTIAVKPALLEFEHGQQIELQAIADSAYQFDHWELSSQPDNYEPILYLTVNEPLTVTAFFVARQYEYEFSLEPETSGSFFANNANFGDSESAFFTHGDSVEIQVVPVAGYDVTGSITVVDPDGIPLAYQTVGGNDKKIILSVDSNATISAAFSEDYDDTDGDGLDNYTESLHGSDPFSVDSDGDSMDDLWEVTHLLNPLDPLDAGYDPDYDTVTNLQEYQSGTFPRNPDSDGDGYIDIYDPQDSSALASGYSYVTIQMFPIGAGIARGEGAHKDGTTVPITIEKENPGFVFINWEGDLSTTDHNTTLLVDSSKTVIANFSKDYRDTDSDGLDNYTEGLLGTDTNKTDTDGDGIDDGVEVNAQDQIETYEVTGIFDPTKSDKSFFDFLGTLNLATPTSSSAGSTDGNLLYNFIDGWFYTTVYGWSFATAQSNSVYSTQNSAWLNFQMDSSNTLKLLKWDYATNQWVDYDYASSLIAAAGHYTLTVEKNNPDGGEVSPSSTYSAGTTVTVEAAPSSGYHFVGWEGDKVSTDPIITFVLDKNVTVKAVFLTPAEISEFVDGSPGN